MKLHSSDNLYDLDYITEKHTQQIAQSTLFAHEEQVEHSMYNQKLEDCHSLEGY
jgi:hypothetical protein